MSSLDICSETRVALTDVVTELTSRSPLHKQHDTVILRTRRRNYPIRSENFAKYSEKIRKLLERNELPATIDLSCYNVDAVRTMTDFLAGVDIKNLRMKVYMFPDLLQLARIFRMRQLTDLVAQNVIERVETGSTSSLLLALHLVSTDWSLFLNVETASSLLQTAAENINDVIASTFFCSLPCAIIVMLFSRCDINVSSELELCKVCIRWLSSSARSDEEAEILFSCIRTPYLSHNDREIIRSKAAGLPESMIEVIEKTLNSARNHRCCIIKSHVERRLPRCGIPDNSLFTRVHMINVTAKSSASKVPSQIPIWEKRKAEAAKEAHNNPKEVKRDPEVSRNRMCRKCKREIKPRKKYHRRGHCHNHKHKHRSLHHTRSHSYFSPAGSLEESKDGKQEGSRPMSKCKECRQCDGVENKNSAAKNLATKKAAIDTPKDNSGSEMSVSFRNFPSK